MPSIGSCIFIRPLSIIAVTIRHSCSWLPSNLAGPVLHCYLMLVSRLWGRSAYLSRDLTGQSFKRKVNLPIINRVRLVVQTWAEVNSSAVPNLHSPVEADGCLVDWDQYRLGTCPPPSSSLAGGGGGKGKFLWCIHAHCASYCAKVSKCLPRKYQERRGYNECGNGFVLVLSDEWVHKVKTRSGFSESEFSCHVE